MPAVIDVGNETVELYFFQNSCLWKNINAKWGM